MSNFIFEFSIGETEINKIHLDDEFDVEIKAINKSVIAKIIELKPSSEDKKAKFSYSVKAKLLNNRLSIKPGFTGIAEFLLEKKEEILTIKEKNIIYKGRKPFVEIISDSDKVKEIEISRGMSDGIYTEITEGLSKDNRVKIQ